ncbi:MAG: ubiquinone/menaquinone biosynthesis methyltransferase, partial [Alistipes sp.]|nr:ubiquinone/menaquinone biosynthesis methyltransferase [Alistipes sp.]
SKGMLEVAKKKVNEASLAESITLEVGSAEQLSSISDNTFDAVTVAFGVRNFGNLEQGLKEIFRVLRPGGSVVILEFSNPTNPIISRLYKWYSHKILPRIGGAISKDRSAYEYLPASVDEFPQPKRFTEILTQVGFSDSRARSLSFGIAQIYTAKR